MATAAQAARHICISETRFHQRLNSGSIKRDKRGNYDLDAIRDGEFKRLRDKLRARGDGNNANGLTAERARLMAAKANTAVREDLAGAGKLVDIRAVVKLINAERAIVREHLATLGGVLQGPLDMIPGTEAAAMLDDRAREIMLELSDPDSLVRRAARVAVGLGDAHDAAVVARGETEATPDEVEIDEEDEDEGED
jgi:hypothetical protein